MTLQSMYNQPSLPHSTYLPVKREFPNILSPLMASARYDPLKDANEPGWRYLPPMHPGFYLPYDSPMSPYTYANGFSAPGYDVARRKNATKEATNTLKAWLYEHRKNPYPTKGEKIMLAIITKMTMTQISTWFANARRRLKKENKMTWSPRSKSDDEESEGETPTIDSELNVTTDEEFNENNTTDFCKSTSGSPSKSPTSTSCISQSVGTARRQCTPAPQLLQLDDISPPMSPTSSPQSSMKYEHCAPNLYNRDSGSDETTQTKKTKIWSVSEFLSDKNSSKTPRSTSLDLHHDTLSHSADLSKHSSLPDRVPHSHIQYSAHASQIIQGHGFAFLSGNGGASHTWNALTLPSHNVYSRHISPLIAPTSFSHSHCHQMYPGLPDPQ